MSSVPERAGFGCGTHFEDRVGIVRCAGCCCGAVVRLLLTVRGVWVFGLLLPLLAALVGLLPEAIASDVATSLQRDRLSIRLMLCRLCSLSFWPATLGGRDVVAEGVRGPDVWQHRALGPCVRCQP